MHTMYNLTHRAVCSFTHNLRYFVARQFVSQIYAVLLRKIFVAEEMEREREKMAGE